tara:strand:- start:1514 stop:1981 length:468 start_codon:yes stop_codon:yes gene_type:complete
MLKYIHLFTDGSVNTKTKVGLGAILITNELEWPVNSKVLLKEFNNTSSTTLEIQILLWALRQIEDQRNVKVYTDSQNTLSLIERKTRLIKNDFKSKTGKELNNAALYRKFYSETERLNIQLYKVKGHNKSINKDLIAQIFGIVDKESRKALRQLN